MGVNASGATSGIDSRPGRALWVAEEWSGHLEPWHSGMDRWMDEVYE